MFGTLKGPLRKWVTGNLAAVGREEATESGADLAVAALLVELARADFKENPDEFGLIRQLLGRYLGQTQEQVDRLLQAAMLRADRAVSLHEFTRELNAQLGEADKLEMVEMLWRVSTADARIDPHEAHLVRKVADLLHVRERDLIRLRIKVQEESPAKG